MLHKNHLNGGFMLVKGCEKHFHDHDETWIILAGKGTGYWIDFDGKREEFVLEAGDVWMIPAGYEHGSDGPNTGDFKITAFNGTDAQECQNPGEHTVEKEGYIPSLKLVKTKTARYLGLPQEIPGFMFVEKGVCAIQNEPMPECGPNQVLCRTLYTGLTNGTERNVLMGGNYGGTWPRRIGYQNVGEVVMTGAEVDSLAVGDIIFTGNFAQHRAWFPAWAAADHLIVKLPETIKPAHAALFGVAGVAMQDVRAADVGIGDKVLVVGAGPIGFFTAQAARAAGADVTLIDLDESRLALGRKVGIRSTFQITGDSSWEELGKIGSFDVIMEDSGAPILNNLIGLLARQGRLVMVAGRQDVTYRFNAGQNSRLRIIHPSHFVRSDLDAVVRLVAEGIIQVEPLIENIVPWNQAVSIYDRLRDQPNSLGGTVFDWSTAHQ